jgi:hypothetical protein
LALFTGGQKFMSFRTLLAVAALAFSVAGCSMTVGEVNPHPNVVVTGNVGTLSVDTTAVQDTQQLDHVQILAFRQSIANGFHGAIGDKFTPQNTPGSARVVITQANLEMSNLGNIGRFLTIRYRAKWLSPDGKVVAEVAGTAQPRNPTETGPRHLEDVIEVMVEGIIDGFDKASAHRQANATSNVASW